MNLENFDDEKYYRNVMKGKKSRKIPRKDMHLPHHPKSKPKDSDYHLIAKRARAQKRTNWHTKMDSLS